MMQDLESANRTYHIVQDHMRLLPNYYRWTYGLADKYLKGTVTELGCGAGFGLHCYINKADKIYAVDHSAELLDSVSKAYPGGKVQPILADLQTDWEALKTLRSDTVILMDVLEHFRDDRLLLQKAATLLKPGGYIVVKVPAHKKLYSAIDRASGHYRRYDRKDMEMIAKELGFRVAEMRLINMPAYLVYGLKKNRNSNFSKTFSPVQLHVINYAMPIIKLFDEGMRFIVGKWYRGLSVLVVFQI